MLGLSSGPSLGSLMLPLKLSVNSAACGASRAASIALHVRLATAG